MSKVKLTKKQADALCLAVGEYEKDDVLNDHIAFYPDFKNWANELESLNELEPHVLARALYIGYEVEPEPKTGDWVVTPSGTVGRLLAIPFSKPHSKKFKFYVDSLGYRKPERLIPLSELERATPEEIAEEKERRWWAKHGRKPWELKIFDILHDGQHPYVITRIDHEYNRIELDGSGNLDLNGIEKRFKVACFVENRMDVKE